MSEGLFIELYDELSHRWFICCPFNNKVYISTQEVRKYFKTRQTLFILAA